MFWVLEFELVPVLGDCGDECFWFFGVVEFSVVGGFGGVAFVVGAFFVGDGVGEVWVDVYAEVVLLVFAVEFYDAVVGGAAV